MWKNPQLCLEDKWRRRRGGGERGFGEGSRDVHHMFIIPACVTELFGEVGGWGRGVG